MQKISLDTVCKHVYDRNFDAILDAENRECPFIPYSFREFTMDARSDDFISSSATIRAKWDGLLASGVIEQNARKTVLNLGKLGEMCKRRVAA